jgi:hypothetical protein
MRCHFSLALLAAVMAAAQLGMSYPAMAAPAPVNHIINKLTLPTNATA